MNAYHFQRFTFFVILIACCLMFSGCFYGRNVIVNDLSVQCENILGAQMVHTSILEGKLDGLNVLTEVGACKIVKGSSLATVVDYNGDYFKIKPAGESRSYWVHRYDIKY